MAAHKIVRRSVLGPDEDVKKPTNQTNKYSSPNYSQVPQLGHLLTHVPGNGLDLGSVQPEQGQVRGARQVGEANDVISLGEYPRKEGGGGGAVERIE